MTLSLRSACVGIASALVATGAMAQAVPPAPPSNQVAIGGTASPGCWASPNSGGGITWEWNGTSPGAVAPGGSFTSASAITISQSQLINTSTYRAQPNPGGAGLRLRFALNCNAPTTATLTAAHGRLLNQNQQTLPANMPQAVSATRSGTFMNAYRYTTEFGFVNTVAGAQPPSNAQKVNLAGGGYINTAASPALNTAPAQTTLATAVSGGDWANIRRLDLRFQLTAVPDVNGVNGVKPVMIAGDYKETFTITVAPGL